MKTITRRNLLALVVSMAGGCAPLLGGVSAAGPARTLAAELDVIFDDPSLDHAHWGVIVRSLDTGETIYERNADRLFLPASNLKLLTAAAALEALGPEYRYRTTISTGGPVRNGVLEGSLVVTGSGDPTFSGRFLAEPRDVFRGWADSLRAHGITRVAGGIVGVDTAFVGAHLGAGWAWDDLTSDYAAELGALVFNEGAIELDIFPNRTILQPAIVIVTPPTQAVRIINDTRTMPEGSITAIRVLRDEVSSGLIVRGEVAADAEPVRRSLAAGNPAQFFISVLRETLREQGISVEGPAVRHTSLEAYDATVQTATPLFIHSSPPLREILGGMMKPSQNLLAETLLWTMGRELRRQATTEGGVAVVDSLLVGWQITRPYRMADGSGLSRYSLASPALFAEILGLMDRGAHRSDWIASFPVAGRDGTLSGRMREPPLLERVHAKTGTLSGARALSGYLTTLRGERIVFSAIANHYILPATNVDRLVETALERIATQR